MFGIKELNQQVCLHLPIADLYRYSIECSPLRYVITDELVPLLCGKYDIQATTLNEFFLKYDKRYLYKEALWYQKLRYPLTHTVEKLCKVSLSRGTGEFARYIESTPYFEFYPVKLACLRGSVGLANAVELVKKYYFGKHVPKFMKSFARHCNDETIFREILEYIQIKRLDIIDQLATYCVAYNKDMFVSIITEVYNYIPIIRQGILAVATGNFEGVVDRRPIIHICCKKKHLAILRELKPTKSELESCWFNTYALSLYCKEIGLELGILCDTDIKSLKLARNTPQFQRALDYAKFDSCLYWIYKHNYFEGRYSCGSITQALSQWRYYPVKMTLKLAKLIHERGDPLPKKFPF